MRGSVLKSVTRIMKDGGSIELTRSITKQKMKFPIKDFFSKCDQIHSKLRIWSHLLKKSFKGTLMQMWKSNSNLRLFIKIICQWFCIITPFTFWDIRTRDIWNVYLQIYRNYRICWKGSLLFKKIQTSRVNNSTLLRIKNAKLSEYCF